MSDPLVHQLELVELVVKRLRPRQAFAFAFACLERQWPIYEQSSIDKPWSPAGLRTSIDQAWEQLLEKKKMPGYLVDRCRRSCPHDDDLVDSGSTAAHLISHSAIDLLSALEGNESGFCHFLAARNLDLLQMLADEFDEQEIRCDIKSLIDREIKQQKNDLLMMRISPNTKFIEGLRKGSTGINLFGEMWFPE